MKLKVVTFNMHKGHTLFKKNYSMANIRQLLEKINPDIVFLQELHGYHPEDYESIHSPLEELADLHWPHFKHGVNSVYPSNFHGNAIMSRFPIIKWDNTNISTNFLEKRGLLYAQIEVKKGTAINLFCTHLNLSPHGQYAQIKKITPLVSEKSCSPHRIFAGDFNDWSYLAHWKLSQESPFKSVELHKTYPSFYPVLALDRIYYTGLKVIQSSTSAEYKHCSDHIPIIVDFEI